MGELIATLDNYLIYKTYINDNDYYYLCIPRSNISKCQICLGFYNKDFDSLSRDKIVSEISNVNNMIHSLSSNIIYAIPNIPFNMLEEAALENDDRTYYNIYNNKILPVTSDIYNMLIKNNIEKDNINRVILVIKRNENDKKLANWLAIKLGDYYIKEIDFDKLKENVFVKKDITELEINSNKNVSVSIPILEHPFESVYPIFKDDNISSKKKKKSLPNDNIKTIEISSGFSDIKFIILGILISLVIGIGLAYLSMK